jgi:hypothetical protein
MKREPYVSDGDESETDYSYLLKGFDPAASLLGATPTKPERAKPEFTTPPPNKAPKPRGDYHPGWTVPKKSRGARVTMTHDATGRTFSVLKTKFNKACLALDSSTFTFLLAPAPGDCRCSRVCTRLPLTADQVLKERIPIWTADESARTLFAKQLRSQNLTLVGLDGTIPVRCSLQYRFAGHQVCSAFWRVGMGASDHMTRAARSMAMSGNFDVSHGGRHLRKVKTGSAEGEASPALKVHAFWTNYFDIFCQRPEEKLRLFPTQEAFPHLYKNTFLPHIQKMEWKETPSIRCFETVACNHKDFNTGFFYMRTNCDQ